MTIIYENRRAEIAALNRQIHALTRAIDILSEQADIWERIALRGVYELNKTDLGWQVMTHEQILERLCELENCATPKA